MQDENILKKFDHEKIQDILQELELPEELRNRLAAKNIDMEIINLLVGNEHLQAAVKFLALGLPKREVVWWAYICAAEIDGHAETIDLIQQWVKQPNENLRRKAGDIAEELGLYTPLGWAATALFWSGGSIAPPDKPAAEPELFMCGEAVANAISLAAENSENSNEKMKLYLKRGLHIAMGGNGRIN
jgi:hypothetical protein